MSIGQTGSVMTVEEEIVRCLTIAAYGSTLREVLRDVGVQRPDLTQWSIKEGLRNLLKEKRVRSKTFFELA